MNLIKVIKLYASVLIMLHNVFQAFAVRRIVVMPPPIHDLNHDTYTYTQYICIPDVNETRVYNVNAYSLHTCGGFTIKTIDAVTSTMASADDDSANTILKH